MSESRQHELAVRMAELARSVTAPRTMDDVLLEATTAAVELIDGADAAGILLVQKGGTFESRAGTSGLPHELDELQFTVQEGPCLSAALHDLVVQTNDFRAEKRWPAYTAAVMKVGVLSGMSFRLYTSERTAGALNVFGYEPVEWDDEAITIGTVLAAHAVAAIAATRESEQLHSALATRDVIGQAKGIIMERFNLDDIAAFQMLRRLSQDSNTPLSAIAQRVVDTRG